MAVTSLADLGTTLGKSVAVASIVRVGSTEVDAMTDYVAVEEPMEIRLGYDGAIERARRSVAVTMRTPGHDAELAIGFLYNEGVVREAGDVSSVRKCEQVESEAARGNVINVDLKPGVTFDADRLERHFYATSSCGVCGKASIEAIGMASCPVLPPARPLLTPSLVCGLPETLCRAQAVFERTGGLHAAALFDTDGKLMLVREDVGRHNAVDKLVGACLLKGLLPLHDRVLLVSGRASFELTQKALMAGLPVLAAVSAPSSLAVNLAEEFGMTLIGFVRGDRFNVYSGAGRLHTSTGDAFIDVENPEIP